MQIRPTSLSIKDSSAIAIIHANANAMTRVRILNQKTYIERRSGIDHHELLANKQLTFSTMNMMKSTSANKTETPMTILRYLDAHSGIFRILVLTL